VHTESNKKILEIDMLILKGLVACALVGLGIFALQAEAASSPGYCPNVSLPTLFAPMQH
jgi:hypothetical protein